MMTFEGLGLDAKLVQATTALGYVQPTPIQEQAIPVLLKERNCPKQRIQAAGFGAPQPAAWR